MTWLAETAMLSHGWRRFLLLVVAGAIAALSIAPLFVLPALFVTFPIWIWCLDGAERRGGWQKLFGPAFGIGFAFGLGYFTVSFHWLGAAFFVDGGIMIAIMPFAMVSLAALIALFWGFASALAHLFWSNGAWRVVTLATFLTIAEWARGHYLSGFPFDLLGYALTPTEEMMQLASVIGIYGLTFLAALLAMTPSLIWPADQRTLTRRLAPFFLGLLALVGQMGFGYNRLAATPVTPMQDIRIRLVQPLIYEHADWSKVDPAATIDRLLTLSQMQVSPEDKGLAGITQLIWPESALPFFLSQYPEALARIARMLPDTTILLTGAPRQDYVPGDAPSAKPPFNSLLAINGDGEVFDSYDKSHLVPFGEFLPFQGFFAQLGIKQFVPGADGWAHGDARRRLMSLPNMPPFLALICYEALFSGDLGDTVQARYLLNITNDAWFDGSIGPAQHAQHARVRAVEEGMSLISGGQFGRHHGG
ncbi:apolipoprotein N-acyltransferase [Devosia rhodophyticola]|uniref:Apolipoprotein N-acyltransferase n=1 Tax=Devosia rhodophyticola TaxID=3026423 RepID=A0ABY7Z079_9HYPH|nr:apolipoprotein N-acyltransferase [Devosia rhodophyticola]WDR07040.1 apolipoprotein N-acyltransferase [Devosia rhodophyticola]